MEINKLIYESYNNSLKKGFWDVNNCNIPEKLMLIVSELSEALEEYRANDDRPMIYYNPFKPDKPEGFGIEIADAVIRIADLCGKLDIDLNECLRIKMKYNKTRPFRHGNKKC